MIYDRIIEGPGRVGTNEAIFRNFYVVKVEPRGGETLSSQRFSPSPQPTPIQYTHPLPRLLPSVSRL